MLPAEHRLTHPAEFRRVIKRGDRAGTRTLVAHVRRAGDPGGSLNAPGHPVRVGLSVSKAVGNAVVRNRVKRRLRHAARERLGTFPEGTDVVLRANPPAAAASYADLAADLDRALTRAATPAGTAR